MGKSDSDSGRRARRANDLGPVGVRVAANLRRLRGRLTARELAERLDALDRPILATGIAKIEYGERRVDVDDLVALALALEVTPSALLMPSADERDDEVALTPALTDDWEHAWRWMTGEEPSVRWTDDQPTGVGWIRDAAKGARRLSTAWIHRFFELARPYESDEERSQRLVTQVRPASKRES